VREVHLVYGRVVAVGLQDRGPRLARVVDLEEVGGQRAALERYLQRLDRRREQRRSLLEAVGFALERLDQAGIHRLAVEREIRGTVVGGGPEVRLARAHRVAGGRALVADPCHAVGRGDPLAVPVVGAGALAYPPGRGRDLAEVGPSVVRIEQPALAEPVVQRVGAEHDRRPRFGRGSASSCTSATPLRVLLGLPGRALLLLTAGAPSCYASRRDRGGAPCRGLQESPPRVLLVGADRRSVAHVSIHPNLLSPRTLLRPFFPQGLVLCRKRLTRLFGQRSEDQTHGVGAGDVARTAPHTKNRGGGATAYPPNGLSLP
jgi:hypothetical protein